MTLRAASLQTILVIIVLRVLFIALIVVGMVAATQLAGSC